MLYLLLYSSTGLFLFLLSFAVWCRFRRKHAVAFLHPYCEMGGGGEVVLWKAVQALCEHENYKRPIYVYTKTMDAEQLEYARLMIRERFGLDLNATTSDKKPRIRLVHIWSRSLLEPRWYPRFTLFGQFLGGIIVSLECLIRLNPAVLVESTGIPGALPTFRIFGGSKVLVYLHYPTITTNMIQRVQRREAMYNNAGFIARNSWLSNLKSYYYLVFAWIYKQCGRCTSLVLVNGTFTKRHIEELWPSAKVKLCFPPVVLDKFSTVQSKAESLLASTPKRVNIVSLGQFRPEKNHKVQFDTLRLLKQQSGYEFCLYLVGGTRNDDDRRIVMELQEYAKSQGLNEHRDFKFFVNSSMEKLFEILSKSMFGIHTMIDEHFGIALVEMMRAGVILVAHESGGPLFDIIGDKRDTAGFLGKEAKDYSTTITNVLKQTREERDAIRTTAFEKAEEFSEQSFKKNISDEVLQMFSRL